MKRYSKIETLFKRGDDGKVTREYRLPEFEMIKPESWIFTEKIDGMNIRISLSSTGLDVRGRSDAAQIPEQLMAYIDSKLWDLDRWKDVFPDIISGEAGVSALSNVTLFGEGYGPKIQSGGEYAPEQRFVLFDVRVGEWWLNWGDVKDVAGKMGIDHVLECSIINPKFVKESVAYGFPSLFAEGDRDIEGIVARLDPQLRLRNGSRLMWKLKTKDFK